MVGLNTEIINTGKYNEITIIKAQGYIDSTTAPEIKKIIEELIEAIRYKIIIDLEGIEYISITGWDVFFFKLKEIRSLGGEIVTSNMIKDIQNIFDLMELPLIIKSFSSVKNAVAYLYGEKVEEKKEKNADINASKTEQDVKEDVIILPGEVDSSETADDKPAHAPTQQKIFDITNAEVLPMLPKNEENKS